MGTESKQEVTISAEELDELKQQLQGCTPCLEFVESLKTTVKLCHELRLDETPSPLEPSSKERIQGAWKAMLAKRAASATA